MVKSESTPESSAGVRHYRDASGLSIPAPHWNVHNQRSGAVAFVLHVATPAEAKPYLDWVDSHGEPVDVFVMLPADADADADAAPALAATTHGRRTVLAAEPVGRGLYQLTSLVNAGLLTGYSLVVRHRVNGDDAWGRFVDLVGDRPLSVLDGFVHSDLSLAGIVAPGSAAPVPRDLFLHARQIATRVSTRISTVSVEPRSLATFAIRGAFVVALATLRVDRQDYFLRAKPAKRSHEPGAMRARVPDRQFARALEIAFFALVGQSEMRLETVDAVGRDESSAGWGAATDRASAWAVYDPHLVLSGPSLHAWPTLLRATPSYYGQELPIAPTTLGFTDSRSPIDRAAQTALARRHGVSAFLVGSSWNTAGLAAAAMVESLGLDEDFPWALIIEHPVQRTIDPHSTRAAAVSWADPGVEHYAALAERVAAAVARGSYLRLDGKAVVLVHDLAMLDDPRAFVEAIRGALAGSGVEAWIGVAETATTGDGYPPYMDGLVQVPAIDGERPATAKVGRRLNNFSGRVVDIAPRAARSPTRAARADDDVYPGVLVDWAQTPVLRAQGDVGFNSNVFAFRRALESAVSAVAARDAPFRIVAVRSWNGWADLSQLEPSAHRGAAYLAMLDDALGISETP